MPEAAPDALIQTRDLPIRLPVFEGPLDLLLYLIRRNEVDIYDIPIEQVTRQYLGILRSMKELQLDVAGDFFVMAATLMYIKSRMLLPTNEQAIQPEEDEEEADPRWELVQQLLEYKKFKEAAAGLEDLIARQQDQLPRQSAPAPEEQETRPLKPTGRIELWNTFNNVLRRLAEQLVQGEIHEEQVTVAERMEHVLEQARREKHFTFSSLFPEGARSIPYLVATFLAVLEMARLGEVLIFLPARPNDFFLGTPSPDEADEVTSSSGSEGG